MYLKLPESEPMQIVDPAGAVTEEVSGTGVDLTGSDTGITDTIEPGDGYETVPGDTVDIGIPEEEFEQEEDVEESQPVSPVEEHAEA